MPKKAADTTPDKYKPMEWEQNCVLQALSKVLGEGQFELTRRLVDGKIGELTMMKQIENNSVIKKVLTDLKFTPLKTGGCSWENARQLMGGLGEEKRGRLFAIWWHGMEKEDWTDTDRKGVASDHAFAIYCNETDIEVPVTNLSNFDKFHPEEKAFVSVFIPPTPIKCKRRLVLPKYKDKKGIEDPSRGDRRFQYNS